MQMKDVIRQKRRERGMTQEQVAERLGVSAPAVNKWESGASYPTSHCFRRWPGFWKRILTNCSVFGKI